MKFSGFIKASYIVLSGLLMCLTGCFSYDRMTTPAGFSYTGVRFGTDTDKRSVTDPATGTVLNIEKENNSTSFEHGTRMVTNLGGVYGMTQFWKQETAQAASNNSLAAHQSDNATRQALSTPTIINPETQQAVQVPKYLAPAR